MEEMCRTRYGERVGSFHALLGSTILPKALCVHQPRNSLKPVLLGFPLYKSQFLKESRWKHMKCFQVISLTQDFLLYQEPHLKRMIQWYRIISLEWKDFISFQICCLNRRQLNYHWLYISLPFVNFLLIFLYQ